jgi:diguanylate cyclase (GGDEF)-like protein
MVEVNSISRPHAGHALRRPTFSIRSRLIVLAVIAIAPLVAERIRDLAADRSERIEMAYNNVRDLAKIGAEKQNEILATTHAFLQVVARSYATFGSSEECGRFLGKLAMGLPWAKVISVTRPDGVVVCSNNPQSLGLDVSDRPYLQRATETGEFVVSDYLFGRRVKGPMMFAAFPQRNSNGATEAVVIAAIDLSWIGRRATSVGKGAGLAVLMVDASGTVVAREPDTEGFVGRNFSDQPLVRALLAQSEGTVTEKGLDGVRRVYGFVRLPNTDARFAVGLDESEVLRPVNRAMWISFIQLALIAGAVLVGIWFGGDRLLAQPIRRFADIATQIGHGDLHTRTKGGNWATEFKPLATAIDDMAEQLAAHEHLLRDANERLKQEAQIDALTGLANRRNFDGQLAEEWQAAARLKRPVALLMIDVDHFKPFNDRYGHPQGDFCLRRLGKILSAAIRKDTDLAVRYGGEEFVLLLPGADIAEAAEVAERLRRAVEELRIVHAAVPSGHVTVSIGVASLVPGAGETAEQLIEVADAALYAAKHRGRNTVMVQRSTPLAAAS